MARASSDYTRYDRAVADLAVEWLEQAAGRRAEPWCLYVGFVAPHFPLIAPQEFYDLYPLDSLPEPKLNPRDGYRLHPWNQAHDDFWSHETTFKDATERRMAIAAYYGLVSWLDHNVGRLNAALERTGLADTTRVIYGSDHGDNLGARGLWGKSNLYRESVDVPLLMAGPGIGQGVCETAVSLLDLSVTLPESAGLDARQAMPGRPGRSLFAIASAPSDPERPVFSEYHAVGSETAGYMLRKGRWKYHYYVRYRPELFDLANDPEETTDLANSAEYAEVLAAMESELRRICDPEDVDRQAKRDQRALIDRLGGTAAVLELGKAVAGGTPPPRV